MKSTWKTIYFSEEGDNQIGLQRDQQFLYYATEKNCYKRDINFKNSNKRINRIASTRKLALFAISYPGR